MNMDSNIDAAAYGKDVLPLWTVGKAKDNINKLKMVKYLIYGAWLLSECLDMSKTKNKHDWEQEYVHRNHTYMHLHVYFERRTPEAILLPHHLAHHPHCVPMQSNLPRKHQPPIRS